MATVTDAATVKEALREHAGPILDRFEENARQARRAIVAGRHAVEDYAAETAIQVRRHPFTTIVVAAGAGALFGCLIGYTLGGHTRRPASE